MNKFRVILCCILVVALSISVTGCDTKAMKINWNLYGTWITERGETAGEVSFSVSGNLPTTGTPSEQAVLTLDIEWNGSAPPLQFVEQSQFSAYAIDTGVEAEYTLLLCHGSAYNPTLNRGCAVTLLLCPEKEVLILEHSDNKGVCLVASTDMDADIFDIWVRFQEFL